MHLPTTSYMGFGPGAVRLCTLLGRLLSFTAKVPDIFKELESHWMDLTSTLVGCCDLSQLASTGMLVPRDGILNKIPRPHYLIANLLCQMRWERSEVQACHYVLQQLVCTCVTKHASQVISCAQTSMWVLIHANLSMPKFSPLDTRDVRQGVLTLRQSGKLRLSANP